MCVYIYIYIHTHGIIEGSDAAASGPSAKESTGPGPQLYMTVAIL